MKKSFLKWTDWTYIVYHFSWKMQLQWTRTTMLLIGLHKVLLITKKSKSQNSPKSSSSISQRTKNNSTRPMFVYLLFTPKTTTSTQNCFSIYCFLIFSSCWDWNWFSYFIYLNMMIWMNKNNLKMFECRLWPLILIIHFFLTFWNLASSSKGIELRLYYIILGTIDVIIA